MSENKSNVPSRDVVEKICHTLRRKTVKKMLRDLRTEVERLESNTVLHELMRERAQLKATVAAQATALENIAELKGKTSNDGNVRVIWEANKIARAALAGQSK